MKGLLFGSVPMHVFCITAHLLCKLNKFETCCDYYRSHQETGPPSIRFRDQYPGSTAVATDTTSKLLQNMV